MLRYVSLFYQTEFVSMGLQAFLSNEQFIPFIVESLMPNSSFPFSFYQLLLCSQPFFHPACLPRASSHLSLLPLLFPCFSSVCSCFPSILPLVFLPFSLPPSFLSSFFPFFFSPPISQSC